MFAADARMAKVWAIRLAIAVGLLALWEVLSIQEGGLFLPRASTTLSTWVSSLGTAQLWDAVYASNLSIMVGFPLTLVVGIPLGLMMGRLRTFDRFFGYYLDLMLVIPMIAVIPVIIAALGLSLGARVAVVFLFAMPVVAMDSRAAVRVVDDAQIEMARAFTATAVQRWTKVILPGAVKPIFAGIRLGLSRAISGMIVVELTLVPAGLGGLIVNYRSQFRAIDLYAATLTILVEGILLVALARWFENRIDRRLRGAHT